MEKSYKAIVMVQAFEEDGPNSVYNGYCNKSWGKDLWHVTAYTVQYGGH
jgi:hypothetical protein